MISLTLASCVLLVLLGSLVQAIPVNLVPRLDIQPPITLPTGSTVWTVGSQQKIEWDASVVPPAASKQTADLLLGWLDSTSEHLQLDKPLATDVLLVDGEVTITVPDYPERDFYIVCLFGSSGNISPLFTIKGGSGSAPPPESSSSTGPSTVSSVPSVPSTLSQPSSTPSSPSTLLPSSSSSSSTVSQSSTTTPPSSTPSSTNTPSGTSTPSAPPASGNSSGAVSNLFSSNNVLLSTLAVSLVALFI